MKIYVIHRRNGRVHLFRKILVSQWCNQNPGECRTWEVRDVVEYVDHLYDQVQELQRTVERLTEANAALHSYVPPGQYIED